MLAEVLAVVTGVPYWHRRVVLGIGVDHVSAIHDSGGHVVDWPWTITDPAEAQETLVARGLLPEGWCDVARRGWHDRRLRSIEAGRLQGYDAACPSPRTIPDLVAVTSLGWLAIQRAEELAREACHTLREYGCPQPDRVVWRVGHPQPAKEVLVVLCPWEKNNETSTWVGVDGVLHDTRWYCGAPKSKLTIGPASSLWDSGLALDAITADAVRIVVPPVGGGRG